MRSLNQRAFDLGRNAFMADPKKNAVSVDPIIAGLSKKAGQRERRSLDAGFIAARDEYISSSSPPPKAKTKTKRAAGGRK